MSKTKPSIEVVSGQVPMPTDPRFKNLTDLVVGRLTVKFFVGIKNHSSHWYCECECGGSTIASAANLKSPGHTTSCGCHHSEVAAKRFRTHGKTDSPEFIVWLGMKARCFNETEPAYRHYGGRGITVCARWRDSFASFLADMGSRPSDKHQIDRIDNNDGYVCGQAPGYGPGNCHWATRKENARNKRNNVMLTLNGVSRCFAEWAEMFSMDVGCLQHRKYRGWSDEKTLLTPVRKLRRKV